MSNGDECGNIEIFTDLKSFFYDGLSSINNNSLTPVPEEAVYYSSHVLEKYSLSEKYFKIQNGKVSEKILGINFLEAEMLSRDLRQKVYKDVGDTALFLVGYFSNSINTKILNQKYYINLGQMAYSKMDEIYPNYLDIPRFYENLATYFEGVAQLLKAFSLTNTQDPFKHLLLSGDITITDEELLVQGISINNSLKAS